MTGKMIIIIETKDDTLLRAALPNLDMKVINILLRPYIKDIDVKSITYDTENQNT